MIIEKIIADECIFCRKNFWWHERVTAKMPENIWFCNPCMEIVAKHDKNKYSWIETWLSTDHQKGKVFCYNITEKENEQK